MCRIDSLSLPQRDFALRDIISLVNSGLGREEPAVGNFNPAIYHHIYTMIRDSQGHELTEAQLTAYWGPVIAEVQRMRPGPVQTAPIPVQAAPVPVQAAPDPVADVEMDGSDSESDSEADSEEAGEVEVGEGEGDEQGGVEIGGGQGEDDDDEEL